MSSILIFSTAHDQGTGAYVMCSEYLSAAASSKHEIMVCAPASGIVYDSVQQNQIPFFPLHTPRDAIGHNLLSSLKKQTPFPEVGIFVAWHTRGFELAVLNGKRWKAPSVGILHDHPDNPLHGACRKRLSMFCAKRFDQLIGVSEAVSSVWKSRIPEARISCVQNGLTDQPASSTLLTKEKIRIGFLGGSTVTKGFPIIEKWIQETADLPVTWQLYGDYTRCDRERVQGMAEFHGRKSPETIYPCIDVLVHASPFFDPYPTVLLEAARAGLPVVASSYGGGGEIVEDGHTGYVFDPLRPEGGLQRLRELLTHPEEIRSLGRMARKTFLRKHRIERMVQEYDRVFDDLLSRHPGS